MNKGIWHKQNCLYSCTGYLINWRSFIVVNKKFEKSNHVDIVVLWPWPLNPTVVFQQLVQVHLNPYLQGPGIIYFFSCFLKFNLIQIRYSNIGIINNTCQRKNKFSCPWCIIPIWLPQNGGFFWLQQNK